MVEIDGDTGIIDGDALGLLRPDVRLGFSGGSGPSPFETARTLDLRVARELAERITDAMERRVPGISPSVLRMARFVFEELGANVLQHSGRPDTGFGTMAFDESRRALELAFADRGVDFLESLQRNPKLQGRIADDAEALQLALTPRVTGIGQSRTNMGMGLKLLVDLSDLLGGDLWVASGSTVLHRRTVAGVRANALRPLGP